MGIERRLAVIFLLGFLVVASLGASVAGYYQMLYEDASKRSDKYSNLYNSLSNQYEQLFQNYTELVEKYNELVDKYNELLENYSRLLGEYQGEKENHTDTVEPENFTMHVNICINYGNGTVVWFNNVEIPLGFDLLNATKLVAIVNYTYWAAYDSCFVDAINGVWNEHPYYWMWLTWNTDEQKWEYGPVGADKYPLSDGETVMWRYEIPNW